MKLTKSKLKQIIKEEYTLALKEEPKFREDVQQDFAIDIAKEVILDRNGDLKDVGRALEKQGIEITPATNFGGMLGIKDDRGNHAWFMSRPDNPGVEFNEGEIIEEIGEYVFAHWDLSPGSLKLGTPKKDPMKKLKPASMGGPE